PRKLYLVSAIIQVKCKNKKSTPQRDAFSKVSLFLFFCLLYFTCFSFFTFRFFRFRYVVKTHHFSFCTTVKLVKFIEYFFFISLELVNVGFNKFDFFSPGISFWLINQVLSVQ